MNSVAHAAVAYSREGVHWFNFSQSLSNDSSDEKKLPLAWDVKKLKGFQFQLQGGFFRP